ncbi:MAG: hypothetical protein V1746_01605 [bacterium]
MNFFSTLWQRAAVAIEWKPIAISLAITAAFLIGLQFWRPYFFLTDDNLSVWLPLLVNTGRDIWHGKSLATTPYLFGGDYPLIKDIFFIMRFYPPYQLISLLANTPLKHAIVDIAVSFNFLVCAAAMTSAGLLIRRRANIKISDAQIILLSVAYTTVPYGFILGSSWMQYTANMGTLPLFTMGLFCSNFFLGLFFIVIGAAHGLMGGHVGPFLYSSIFFSAFVIFKCLHDRSLQPLARWISAGLLTALILSPLLFKTYDGFLHSDRSNPLSFGDTIEWRLSNLLMLFSFLLGPLNAKLLRCRFHFADLSTLHMFCVVFFPLSWLTLIFIAKKLAKWTHKEESFSWLETGFLTSALFAVLFISRPLWLNSFLNKLFIFSSLRWPFKETFCVLFFLTCWLFLKEIRFRSWSHRIALGVGGLLYLLVFFKQSAPSFLPRSIERKIILSGAADVYWEKMKQKLPSSARILPVINPYFYWPNRGENALVLLGIDDYLLMFQMPSVSGFSATRVWKNQEEAQLPRSFSWEGVFDLQAAQQYQKIFPNTVLLYEKSRWPLEIWLMDSRHSERLNLRELLPETICDELCGKQSVSNK